MSKESLILQVFQGQISTIIFRIRTYCSPSSSASIWTYWEVGLNFNGSVVALDEVTALDQNMQISHLELPLSAGLNLLGATRRVLGLRIYGGLVPGYVVKIGDNPFGFEKRDFNQFQLGGRLGAGLDVFFLFIEAGYQYGFMDLLTDQDSNLSQFDLRLGFRF